MKIKNAHTQLFIAIASIASTVATPVYSQSSSPQLEIQYVTAQKRTESLLDVPISVVAIDADKLADASIETLEDLTAFVPNIHFTETGFSTQVRIRGIGSDNSQGLEQSVGMYVDGIYFGRAQLFRTPMMDMERVEVLRGPQSVLFGKNTIAGALNLTTARPTDEFEGSLRVRHEVEHNQTEWNGVVNVPIMDNLSARLAVRDYTEDGYFRNTFKNRDESAADESTVRVSLNWDATDDLSLFFKAERNEFNTVGRPIELTYDVGPTATSQNYVQLLTSPLFNQPSLEANRDFNRQYDGRETSDTTVDNFVLISDYKLDDYTISSVTGLLKFDYDEFCDCDNTSAEILDLALFEKYDQFSQEIRIASPQGNRFEWTAGAFYQKWDQEFDDSLSISNTNLLPSVIPPIAPILAASNANPARRQAQLEALAFLSDTGLSRDFDQSSESWAIFGQTTWNVSDRLHLTVGARFTKEEKDATKVLEVYDLDTQQILPNPVVAGVYLGLFGAENEQALAAFIPDGEGGVNVLPFAFAGHNLEKGRSESAFTPLVNIEYDVNSDTMVYATYVEGFKAGGFDPRSNQAGTFSTPTQPANTPDPDPFRFFEFEEETATSYELGLKTRLADGRGEANVALYRMDYDDLQISQFDGTAGFNPSNAAETRVQGLEIDGRWALTDELTANYGVSWLDFEYLDFENGNCYQGQTEGGTEDIDADGTFDLCDYTGKRGVYTPDYTVNMGLNYERSLTSNMTLSSFIDVQQVDGHQVHVNLDPQGEIDTYTLVSARVALEGENWMVALLGKNLLDEYIISYSANAPLSGSTFQTNTFYSTVRRPRTFALEGQVSF